MFSMQHLKVTLSHLKELSSSSDHVFLDLRQYLALMGKSLDLVVINAEQSL